MSDRRLLDFLGFRGLLLRQLLGHFFDQSEFQDLIHGLDKMNGQIIFDIFGHIFRRATDNKSVALSFCLGDFSLRPVTGTVWAHLEEHQVPGTIFQIDINTIWAGGEVRIDKETVEKAISSSLFFSARLKDRDQSSFCRISLVVCFLGRVSPL